MIKRPMKIDEILLSHIHEVESTFIIIIFGTVTIIFAWKIEVPNRLTSPTLVIPLIALIDFYFLRKLDEHKK